MIIQPSSRQYAKMAVTWVIPFGLLILGSTAVLSKEFPTLNHIKTSTDPMTQANAASDVIKRLIPDRAKEFSITVDPSIGPQFKDTFQLVTDVTTKTVSIKATSGVAAAWGFYYYLSQYCNAHISWAGDQINLPADLPVITQQITVTSNDRFRYYQNVCTVSYSFVWWDWNRWEKEIDWMAMNGINLPLAFNAQEAIWQRVYLKMGFTQEEIDSHFSGPAFLAWYRMGNMQGFGGPMPQGWHENQIALQHKILQRMRDLGITPVLPAFAGHVPKNFSRLFPNASVSRLSDWGGFNDTFCCVTLLDVTDPLFVQIGTTFLTEYIKEFGTDHVYNTDTFNEMTPKSNTTEYLSGAGKAVFDAMLGADSQAIWVMQAWLFLNTGFWKDEQAKALVTSVPQGKMILLDLFSEVAPMYNRFESYWGQPFIWCMLHDFGGTVSMYGVLDSINKGPFDGRAYTNSSMIGIGLTPEGINQNNVVYEFMMENSWRKEPRDVASWITNYAKRRYGVQNDNVDKAWMLLKKSVYNCTDGYNDFSMFVVPVRRPSHDNPLKPDRSVYNDSDGLKDHSRKVIVNARPKLKHPLNPHVWYDPEDVYQAWDNFLIAAPSFQDNKLFNYDLVDVTRQSLQLIAIKFYDDMLLFFKAKDLDKLEIAAGNFINLMAYLERLLATDDHFLLGNWIESAKAIGTSAEDKALYEYNARNQVTLWGPRGNILDYANKQWSGLVRSYYTPRWALFIAQLKSALINGTSFDEAQFKTDVFQKVEQPFTYDTTPYPTTPTGDPFQVSKEIHTAFRSYTIKHSNYFKQLPKFSAFGKKLAKYSTEWIQHIYDMKLGQIKPLSGTKISQKRHHKHPNKIIRH